MMHTRRSRSLTPLLVGAGLLGLVACGGSKPVVEQPPVMYPEEPAVSRIQYLTTISYDRDVVGKEGGLRAFVTGERAPTRIKKAFGTLVHKGTIFVCDAGHGWVWVIDVARKKMEKLGAVKPGRMGQPMTIAVADDGTRYVADSGHKRIMVYDKDNRYVTAFGEPSRWAPIGVALRGRELFVTDIANSQIVVLDRKTGDELRRIGKKGGEAGELYLPTGIALDKDGMVYVSDTGNFRLQKLSPDGEALQVYGRLGKRPGEFARPKGIAVDREGRVYAVDAAAENVQVFANGGKLLLPFASGGNGRGQLNLPFDVFVDYESAKLFKKHVAPGREIEFVIYATSEFGPNKLNVYGFLKLTAADQKRAERSLREYERKLAEEKRKELEEAEKKKDEDDEDLKYEGPGSKDGEVPGGDAKDGEGKPDASKTKDGSVAPAVD